MMTKVNLEPNWVALLPQLHNARPRQRTAEGGNQQEPSSLGLPAQISDGMLLVTEHYCLESLMSS